MTNIIIPSRRTWTRQPQQPVEIDCSNQFWGGQKPLFLHSQSCGPFDLVNNTPLVVNGAPGRLIGSSGIALSSQSSGVSYDGLRVPDVVSGSRSDRLYNKAAPPLTLLTISVANGNEQLSLMRSNGSGSSAFGCGAWYGSNSGGFGTVRTTGGVLRLEPVGFLFDTRVTPIVTIFSIGPTTTRIFSGPIGTMALHVAEAATPTGNFYYEHGDPYRCLSVGGNYNSFAPASWLGAISATEVSSRAAAESLIRNPWQIFRPQTRRSFFDIGAGGAISLAIAKIFQSHALDAVALTMQSDLTVNESSHGQVLEAVSLSTSSLLAVGEASHNHLAENIALDIAESENLIVQESLHGHVADGVALTTQWLLSVADALHGHSPESPMLSLDSHLAVADAGHGHASENMTLGVTGTDNLVVADVLHGQTAEGLTLVTEWLLIVADAVYAQLAESTTLSTDALLVVQEASNAHLAESVALNVSDATTLDTQGGVQGHMADGITLTLDTWLAIVGAAHAHAADAPTLSNEAALQIAEALYAHYADTVVLSFPVVTTLTQDDISAIAAAVLAALQATTIPVDAVTGAWPTAAQNADAVWSKQLP